MKIVNLHSKFKIFNVFLLFTICYLLFATSSKAQTVSYPIPELGNCRDSRECYLYCQIPDNQPACWSYGRYVLKQGQVLADEIQSEQAMTQKYNITFPIAELGNCTSVAECKNYCSDSSHQVECVDFAKKKGFYKEPTVPTRSPEQEQKMQELVQAAKTELGCDSAESCKAFCEQSEENKAKCADFGARHGLAKPTPNPTEAEKRSKTIEAAKQELGCSTPESCKAVCEQNKEKCMAFAKKYHLSNQSQPSQQSPKPSQPISQPPRSLNNQTSNQTLEKSASNSSRFAIPECASGATEACMKAYCDKFPDHCPGFPKASISVYPTGYTKPTYEPRPTSYVNPSYYPKPSSYPSYEPKPSAYPTYSSPTTYQLNPNSGSSTTKPSANPSQ